IALCFHFNEMARKDILKQLSSGGLCKRPITRFFSRLAPEQANSWQRGKQDTSWLQETMQSLHRIMEVINTVQSLDKQNAIISVCAKRVGTTQISQQCI